MTIPEATMGKNNFALRDENKIGSAWEVMPMKTKAVS
jgi:hypothetical protein